jgi:bile acid:Na+ symporter, BASS family
MFLMDTLTKALFYVFLAGSMLGIGLKVGKDDLLRIVRDRSWLARMFIANFLLIPAVGILAAKALIMKPENGLALIILACAPGGMSALQFLSKKKDEAALAYGGGTTVLLSFLSIFISPFLIALTLPKGMTLTVPYGKAILFVSLFMLFPLVLGIIVQGMSGAAARRLAGPVAWVGTLAFIGAMVKLLTLTKWAKGQMGKKGLIGIVIFVLFSMLIGWLLGGPRKFTRPVLATASSMRNGALCLAIAVRSFPDFAVLAPLVAFFAIMVPANMLYMLISKVAGRIAEKRAAGR